MSILDNLAYLYMLLRRFPTSSGELYFGPMPNIEVLKELKKDGFDVIWNLGAELSPLIPIEKQYVKTVIHGNIPDFGTPTDVNDFLAQLYRIVGLLKGGKKIFLHCFKGQGRSGLALAAIKVMMENYPARKALLAAEAFTGGVETKSQAAFIEKLEKALQY